jgi:hypothetical protein
VRFSSDETRTWTSPLRVIAEDGCFVLNNDRVVQLRKGRLVLPVAIHTDKDHKLVSRGSVTAYVSDDAGRTWHRSKVVLECPTPSTEGLQEPGVVELKNGLVMMFIRTRLGRQYVSYSDDQGESWSAVEPSNMLSPQSPALIKRIPKTGDLLLVWNDHSNVDPSLRAVDGCGYGGSIAAVENTAPPPKLPCSRWGFLRGSRATRRAADTALGIWLGPKPSQGGLSRAYFRSLGLPSLIVEC